MAAGDKHRRSFFFVCIFMHEFPKNSWRPHCFSQNVEISRGFIIFSRWMAGYFHNPGKIISVPGFLGGSMHKHSCLPPI